MKLVKSILYVLLSGVACYLGWLIFYFLTPFIMDLSWFWMVAIFLVLGGFIVPLIGFLPGLLALLINNLKSDTFVEKGFCILFVLFFTFSACRLAWVFDISYGFKQILFALMQNFLVVGLFWGLASAFIGDKEDEKGS